MNLPGKKAEKIEEILLKHIKNVHKHNSQPVDKVINKKKYLKIYLYAMKKKTNPQIKMHKRKYQRDAAGMENLMSKVKGCLKNGRLLLEMELFLNY